MCVCMDLFRSESVFIYGIQVCSGSYSIIANLEKREKECRICMRMY